MNVILLEMKEKLALNLTEQTDYWALLLSQKYGLQLWFAKSQPFRWASLC